MPWVSLGSVNPGSDWSSYPADILGSETIRITQGSTDPYNCAYLTQYFPAENYGRVSRWLKIYPTDEARIYTLEIPPDLREQGFTLRTLQIKRRLPFYPSPWSITVEALY